MTRYVSLILGLWIFGTLGTLCYAQQNDTISKFQGFFDFTYQKKKGTILLDIKEFDVPFLYVHSLTTGVGSNDIGLDRGQLGEGVVVSFRKIGSRILLVQQNLGYRAETDNQKEKNSIRQAFAESVLFGFESKKNDKGGYTIDITSFLVQDTHGIASRLKSQGEGTYKIDTTRSVITLDRTKAFPKNVEFEALTTYVGTPEGRKVASVTPDAKAITVTQHHSFVRLPEKEYVKRPFDPRSGALYMQYADYASPVYEPLHKRYILRHRLEKKNPNATLSEAKEPIVYYLDPATPEPVRSALLEGARWWNQAFENIGYTNAFQVKMLPEGADPMDLRYNVIQWVHRSTRGWSYGASIIDPRSGEILKGHVSLGSLRIRQDFMIAQALSDKPFSESDTNHNDMLEMALARIRQLSAHEVGHTLGFAHNFAASVKDRASVMDYPHPVFQLKDNKVDFTNAYATDIGSWDKVTVAYSYGAILPGESEKLYLNSVLDTAFAKGHQFITDTDARAAGGASASAHLWDNGKNPVEELNHLLKVRNVALQNFSKDNIRSGEPYSVLEDVFVPLYVLHRYQVEAVTKLIGGVAYSYALKDTKQPFHIMPDSVQSAALEASIQTITSEVLLIPEKIQKLFPPRAYGYPRTRESFSSRSGVTFDVLGVAASSAKHTLGLLLHPDRASRLIQQKVTGASKIGFEEVLQSVWESLSRESSSSYKNAIRHQVQNVFLDQLFELTNKSKDPLVRSGIYMFLQQVQQGFTRNQLKKSATANYINRRIQLFLTEPEKVEPLPVAPLPDGSPIGTEPCIYFSLLR